MARVEILGRDADLAKRMGNRGCAYLGKVVSYPAGKYEEVGTTFLDIVSPHCMLIVGKRGTGKSYTMGVIAEEFCNLAPEYQEKIATIIIDTMSVFHSLKTPNTISMETKRLKDFNLPQPKGFPDKVKIFMPQAAIRKFMAEGHHISFDHPLQLPLNEVEVFDWLKLFDISPTEPAGVMLIRVISELLATGKRFDFTDIYSMINNMRGKEEVKESVVSLFKLVEKTELFHKVGTPYGALVRGGQVSVLDVSYLSFIGAFDLRSLVVALVGRRLLKERTLYTTLEMQADAGLVDVGIAGKITKAHPLVYMLIDEAHLFLPSSGKTFASDPLIDWIKVGRHPGLSLIFATQEPSALHESAIRQSDVIIAHNVTASADVEALGKAKQTFMSPGQDIQKIVSTMEPKRGLAVIFDDKTRKIEMCRIRPRLSLHTGLDATAMSPQELGWDMVGGQKNNISSTPQRPANSSSKKYFSRV